MITRYLNSYVGDIHNRDNNSYILTFLVNKNIIKRFYDI